MADDPHEPGRSSNAIMSETLTVPKHIMPLWLGCLLVVSFALGIWAAFTPVVGPLIKQAVGVLMIIAGLVLLSPFATARPINEDQRRFRKRISVIGGANVMIGVAQLLPNAWSRIALMSVAVLLMAAAMMRSRRIR